MDEARPDFPIGVSYSVEPVVVSNPETAGVRFDADMKAIARLGVGVVFLRHVRDDQWSAVAAAARANRLEPIRVARSSWQPAWREPPAPTELALKFGTPGNEADRRTAGALMRLPCAGMPRDDAQQFVTRMWALFHQGLAQGLTGGLALDELRPIPGSGAPLAGDDGAVSVELAAAVKRMAARMKAWGPLLDRLDLRDSPALEEQPRDLGLALFGRDRRRFLLAINRSTAEVLRTTLTIPDPLNGAPARRLVEVPADGGSRPGAVVSAGGKGQVVLPLELGPGDAKLFEVFGPIADTMDGGGS